MDARLANTSVLPGPEPAAGRDVDTCPFVELHDGRLQGVVSASSDPNRVYCAFIKAGTYEYYSSTNNNRPDAGTDKRLSWLLEAAVAQMGAERVARYMKVAGDPSTMKTWVDVMRAMGRYGGQRAEPAGVVFSRFLQYLQLVERVAEAGPVPEMAWFVGG